MRLSKTAYYADFAVYGAVITAAVIITGWRSSVHDFPDSAPPRRSRPVPETPVTQSVKIMHRFQRFEECRRYGHGAVYSLAAFLQAFENEDPAANVDAGGGVP